MHGLRDISGMYRVMVGVGAVVPLLDQAEELPNLRRVQFEVRDQTVHVEQVHAQH